MRTCAIVCSVALIACGTNLASADVFQTGADRLAALQNTDGGWNWLLPEDGDGTVQTEAPNILAPVGMGLLAAYQATGDPAYAPALQKAGKRLLNKSLVEMTPDDGYFAAALDSVFEVTTCTDFLDSSYYGPLSTGAFDFFGDGTLFVGTQWYISAIRFWRDFEEIPNLAALDCGLGLYSAARVGADTSAWIEATKAEINDLNGADVFDVLGLAGAVLGLAAVAEDVDPTAGAYASADSLADLAAILAGYQLSTGGFSWNSQNMAEGMANETVQETAFALLALKQFDAEQYAQAIAQAAAYLESVQLPTGGWENFLGQGENLEVTGESLWALHAALPPVEAAETQEQ